jgi:KipI family sensor histidine kinase inhibitor
MLIRPAGDRALLVETREPHALRAAILAATIPGVVDVVPGEETVLVTVSGSPEGLDRRLRTLKPVEVSGSDDTLDIPVVYDGEDLDEVADLTGLSRDEVIRLHSSSSYTVAYLGFSPGFGYLTGLDPALHVPRRATPRTSVPAGSVAIAGPYASVYPSASPGGWRLLGHTSTVLWDVRRDPPSLLGPGTKVRFQPVT